VVHAIPHQVYDPLVAVLPVFTVFIAIEAVAYMFKRDGEPSSRQGYSAIDSRTSIAMGLMNGNVTPAWSVRNGAVPSS
jgi:hypothetical protein